ncbi:hypothetical protein Lser_V15G24853 [Lactuca serriola]
MASLVLILSELLKHHDDAEFGYTSSSSRPCFSGGPVAATGGGGGSCAAAKRVTGKYRRIGEYDVIAKEPEFRVCVEFV